MNLEQREVLVSSNTKKNKKIVPTITFEIGERGTQGPQGLQVRLLITLINKIFYKNFYVT